MALLGTYEDGSISFRQSAVPQLGVAVGGGQSHLRSSLLQSTSLRFQPTTDLKRSLRSNTNLRCGKETPEGTTGKSDVSRVEMFQRNLSKTSSDSLRMGDSLRSSLNLNSQSDHLKSTLLKSRDFLNTEHAEAFRFKNTSGRNEVSHDCGIIHSSHLFTKLKQDDSHSSKSRLTQQSSCLFNTTTQVRDLRSDTKLLSTPAKLSLGSHSEFKLSSLQSTSSAKASLQRDSSTPKAKPKSAGKKLEKKTSKNQKYVESNVMKSSVSDFEYPEYRFGQEEAIQHDGVTFPDFIPPEKDIAILSRSLHDLQSLKRSFINAVSASLIRAPNFKERRDQVRLDLMKMADQVALYDGEFILKMALYTRCDLNIRTTANFLLAFGAKNQLCRPYFKKYFSASIRLPSDWIEVAETYQTFGDKTLALGALPAALRRAMVSKFPDFDQYQLAKYNKENAIKKKRKKERKSQNRESTIQRGYGRGSFRGRGRRGGRGSKVIPSSRDKRGLFDSDTESDEDSSSSDDSSGSDFESVTRQISAVSEQSDEEDLEKKRFTLKQLIRKLHITDPVEHVMSIIGKRYPETPEEFYKTRLPGTWEEERAGKRMKLATPETWETQVSMKGNKADTWEQLIDHRKLPFMAMLRNLRNMIQAGISAKHHAIILKKLSDEGAVINSRQFPFRFFSAYEVLNQLEEEYHKNQNALVAAAEMKVASDGCRGRGGRGPGRQARGRGRGGRSAMDKRAPKEVSYDTAILVKYKKALDTSVKIATVHNVSPVYGTTYVFCNLSFEMNKPCTSARGLGKPRTRAEIACLLGLMCKYSSEHCHLVVYGCGGNHREVELEKGGILDNMQSVLNLQCLVNQSTVEDEAQLPVQFLGETLKDKIQIDNLIVLSNGMTLDSREGVEISNFLDKYRRIVNPNLLFVSVDLSGSASGFSRDIQPVHENDVFIAGYSDQILRFIAERGSGGPLMHVEKIDEAYNIKPLPSKSLLPALPKNDAVQKSFTTADPQKLPSFPLSRPKWRTARVFISSTFRDMHGERDLLTRFVFPELRARARKHFINIYEVDLRWGLTEEETRSNKTLELCLTEVTRCQFFIGILGERYGWIPSDYNVPGTSDFDWVREYRESASITELEMYAAALSDPSVQQERAFFFFRDNSFEKDIPHGWQSDFTSENKLSSARISELKKKVRESGLEVYDGYPCHWGGIVEGKPVVAGLEDFGLRVLNNLWTAIQKAYPDEDVQMDEVTHERMLHEAFIESHHFKFIGRKRLMKQTMEILSQMSSGILMLSGKPGCGKSAFVCSLIRQYLESKYCSSEQCVLSHIFGAAPGSTDITAILRRLCQELNDRFSLNHSMPQDFKNLVIKFSEILKEAADTCYSPLVLFLDGIDLLDDVQQAHSLQWLPEVIPQNVVIVSSVIEGTVCHKALSRKSDKQIIIGALDPLDKPEMVRKSLALHGKHLDESAFSSQMKLLVSKKEANSPLYLTMACEELRIFAEFEKVSGYLKALPHTLPLLLQEVLDRLENDVGVTMLSTSLMLLLCSKDGLLEEELHVLLSYYDLLDMSGKTVMTDVINIQLSAKQLLPQAKITRLVRALRQFLRPTSSESGCLDLAHVDIENAVRRRYMKASASQQEASLHQLLAGYYYKEADAKHDDRWTGTNDRAFSLLPYHLARAGSYDKLTSVICSLHFIYSKCRLGLAPQLLTDFSVNGTATRTNKEKQRFLDSTQVREYKAFIYKNISLLTKHPGMIWQQALNEPPKSYPAQDLHRLQKAGKVPGDLAMMEWTNRPHNADPCYMTLDEFLEPVTCIAISKGNRYIVCGMNDCSVKMFDLETGKEEKTFIGHSDVITGVCFAGLTRICSASKDRTLSLWDAQQGHRIAVMKGHSRSVSACSADGNGKTIVSSGWDGQIKVWQASDGKLVDTIKGSTRPLNCLAFHPEGQKVVIGSWDATLIIWDIFHKSRKAVLRGHLTSVRDVAYSASGQHIASAALDGEVKIWSATHGSQVGSIQGHSGPINKLTFSHAGRQLITVSDDQKIKVWSGNLGIPVNEIGSMKYGAAMCVSFTRDGQSVLVGYHSGHLRRFHVLSGVQEYEEKIHTASVRCLSLNHHSNMAVTGSDDTSLKVTNLEDYGKITLAGHTRAVISVSFSDTFIISGSEDCTVCLFEVQSLQWKSSLDIILQPVQVLRYHTGPVSGVAVNAEQTTLVTSSRDMSMMVWDLSASGPVKLVTTMHACHSDWINGCSWSNTGNFVVTASNDFNLKLWDMKQRKEKSILTGHSSAINAVAYSYGCIVSCCFDGTVKVWSHKGVEITTLYGHEERVNGCDINVKLKSVESATSEQEISDWYTMTMEEEWQDKHKSQLLKKTSAEVEDVLVASCSDDGSVRIWRPLQADELMCLTGHGDRVLSVDCAANGNICSSSLDRTVKMWSPKLGLSSKVEIGHNADITAIVTSSRHDKLISASRDGFIKLWEITAENSGSANASLSECALHHLHSVQAHKQAVQAVCFVGTKGKTFATGSADSSICVWNINITDKRTNISKVRTMVSESPVTSLHCPATVSHKQVLLSTDWVGVVKLWNIATGSCVINVKGHDDWITSSILLGLEGQQKLVTVGTDSRVVFWSLDLSVQSLRKSAKMITKDNKIDINSDGINMQPTSSKQQTNWILSAAFSPEGIYFGDSSGQISIFCNKTETLTTRKVHAGSVSCCVIGDGKLFTGSHDQTIKVWNQNQQQIGQFYCQSAVTTLTWIETSEGNRQLLAGDKLGRIYCLRWEDGSEE